MVESQPNSVIQICLPGACASRQAIVSVTGGEKLDTGVFGVTAPPGRIRFGKGVGVDIDDVVERLQSLKAGDVLGIFVGLACHDIAGGDRQMWIALADPARHVLKDRAILGVVVVARLIADLDALDKRVHSRRPEILREGAPISERIFGHVFPRTRFGLLELQRDVNIVTHFVPDAIFVEPVDVVARHGKLGGIAGVIAQIPYHGVIVTHQAADRFVERGLKSDGMDIQAHKIAKESFLLCHDLCLPGILSGDRRFRRRGDGLRFCCGRDQRHDTGADPDESERNS